MGPRIILDHAAAPDPDPARGVFETMLVVDRRVALWERHRERLRASCLALYGRAPGAADADHAMASAGACFERARLRLDARPHPAGELVVTAEASPLDPSMTLSRAAPELACIRVQAGHGPHKFADRDWLTQIEALAPRGARALLVTRAGTVLETTRANVFVVRDGELTTPPLDGAILPGVVRSLLLEEARRASIPVAEAAVAVAELWAADALLLTSSVRLIERVVLRESEASERAVRLLAAAIAQAAGLPECARGGPGEAPGR